MPTKELLASLVLLYLICIAQFDQLHASDHASEHHQFIAVNESKLYSSFQCIGGSQVMDTNSMKQASVTVFPLNEAAHRTCLFRNVCFLKGELTFFSRYNKTVDHVQVPKEYQPKGFNGNVFHVAYLRAFTLPIKTTTGAIPTGIRFSKVDLTFLDANSWSFNYGHYLIDNVIPAFMAAMLFNLPFAGSQQLYETNCRLFSILEPAFADRLVTYNRSMGSYREACLSKLDGMNNHFFDHPPRYLDQMQSESMCFRRLMTGHGSSYGLKSVDLSRALFLRAFRDFVLTRLLSSGPAMPPQENLVLVGLRTVGSAGGRIINELCEASTQALEKNRHFGRRYKVECFVPSDLSFEDEIRQVQRAKVVVSVHGTISYMVLFTRDGTQQISIASPKELKENQILLYATHFHTLYLTWDHVKELPGLLHHSLTLADEYHQQL